MDQCSIGRSAMFFASQRRSLALVPQWDVFHRCWNDVLGSADHVAGLKRAILFLTVVCNIPYGPWSESKFYQSRKDFFGKFIASSTVDSEWFQASAEEIAADRGLAVPRDRASLEEVFQLCAEVEFLQRKGPQVKKMRWFTLFKSLQDLMPNWALLREAYRYYHGLFHATDEDGFFDALRPSDEAVAAKDYRRELKELRSKTGNTLSLGARIMTSQLKQDMLILFTVVRAHWKHFNKIAEEKLSAADSRQYFASVSLGGWTEPVTESLMDALVRPAPLRRMGLTLGPDVGAAGADTIGWQREVRSKAARFACEFAGARAASSSEYHLSYPGRFAYILHESCTDNDIVKAVQSYRADLACLLELERLRATRDDIDEVLGEVEWPRMPINRVILHMFDRPQAHDVVDAEAAELVRDMFSSFGDSLIIENTHNILRRMTLGATNEVSAEASRQYKCIVSTLLQDRGIPAVNIEESTGQQVKISSQWNPPPSTLSTEWSEVMAPRTGWVSKTPEKSAAAVTAWTWLRFAVRQGLLDTIDVRVSSLSMLFLPGALVRHDVTEDVYIVIRPSAYGAWLAKMQKVSGGGPEVYVLVGGEPTLVYVWNLGDWKAYETYVAAPCENGLVPPVTSWVVTEPLQPLVNYALRHKIDLTAAQLKLVMRAMDIKYSSRKKRELLMTLLSAVFGDIEGAGFVKTLCDETLDQSTAEELEEAEVDQTALECLEALDEQNAKEFGSMKLAAKRRELKDRGFVDAVLM